MADLKTYKAATALAGGVARRGETCGALLGALMALGLAIGRERQDDSEGSTKVAGPASEICRRFQQELTSQLGFAQPLETSLCRDIHVRLYGRVFNLTDAAERKAFLDAGGHSATGCPKVSAVAAQVAAEELLKLGKK